MTRGGRLARTQASVHKAAGVVPRLQAPPLGLCTFLDLVAQLLRARVDLFFFIGGDRYKTGLFEEKTKEG